LQKGDLSNSAQEFSRLVRNYADYGKLVNSLAAQARGLSLNHEYDFNAEQHAAADRALAGALHYRDVAQHRSLRGYAARQD